LLYKFSPQARKRPWDNYALQTDFYPKIAGNEPEMKFLFLPKLLIPPVFKLSPEDSGQAPE
jgi:hypothetical protein